MSDGLKDILSNLNKDIEQEELLKYLNQHMSEAERHAFEKQMNDDDFVNDAVEGLQSVENKHKLEDVVQQLNSDLKKQIEKKKKRKEKRKLENHPWIYYTIILLLLLLVVAYVVIKKMV
ncbi:MAG: hypothetical protein ABIO04_05430 [Ferruginibacter sp.]